jgi:hypothetical protein
MTALDAVAGSFMYVSSGLPYSGPYHVHANGTLMAGTHTEASGPVDVIQPTYASDTPQGFGVDDVVHARPHEARTQDDVLGFLATPQRVGASVRLSSFMDATNVGVDRILYAHNTTPLVLPNVGDQYPAASGGGVGLGTEVDTVLVIIDFESPVQAMRIKPALVVDVYTRFGGGAAQFLGVTTASSADDSVFVFSTPLSQVIVQCVGGGTITNLLFYTSEPVTDSCSFVLFDSGLTVPFACSITDTAVRRKGGMYMGTLSAFNIDLATAPGLHGERATLTHASAKNVETTYVTESTVYDSLIATCNQIFPSLARLSRACVAHFKYMSAGIRDINTVRQLDASSLTVQISVSQASPPALRLNGVSAPDILHLIDGLAYHFSAPVYINGEMQSIFAATVTASDTPYGLTAEIISGNIKIHPAQSLVLHEAFLVPGVLHASASMSTIDTEIAGVMSILPSFTQASTPNTGNAVAHVVLRGGVGVGDMPISESLFLAGESAHIAVYGTHTGTHVVRIDDAATLSITLGSSRYAEAVITVPTVAGFHKLHVTNTSGDSISSNVMLRVSPRCVLHPPLHPAYYSSGQLDNDSRASATVTLVLEFRNVDLIPRGTMSLSASGVLLSVTPTTVDPQTDHSLHAALFCRMNRLDCRPGSNAVATYTGANIVREQTTPWLACADVRVGNIEVSSCVSDVDHFFMWWKPSSIRDVTLFHGSGRVRVRSQRLSVETSASMTLSNDALVGTTIALDTWHSIAFTTVVNGSVKTHKLYVDGQERATVTTSHSHADIPRVPLLVGTIPVIDLTPLLGGDGGGGGGSVTFTGDMIARATLECELVIPAVPGIDPPTHVELANSATPSTSATFAHSGSWRYTMAQTDALPQQVDTVSVAGITNPTWLRNARLEFAPAGFVRNLSFYTRAPLETQLRYAAEHIDSVLAFAHVSTTVMATNVEQTLITLDEITHTTSFSPADTQTAQTAQTVPWCKSTAYSSAFVTPPSLVLINTSQQTPYSTSQSVLLNFNRQVETFVQDSSTLFTLSHTPTSDPTASPQTRSIAAQFCTLLSSQIRVPNSELGLERGMTYTLTLAEGRLFHANGRVPCLAGSVTFSTED